MRKRGAGRADIRPGHDHMDLKAATRPEISQTMKLAQRIGDVDGRLLPGCQSLEVGTGRYGIGTGHGVGVSGCRYACFSRFTVFSV